MKRKDEAHKVATFTLAILVVTSMFAGIVVVSQPVDAKQSEKSSEILENTGLDEETVEKKNLAMSTATQQNGTVYVGEYNGNVYAFDAQTGSQKWSYTTASYIYSGPTVANGTVYVGSTNSPNLYAIDAENGTLDWKYTGATNAIEGSPTIVDGTVYFGSEDNNAYAVNATTGNLEWSYSTGASITGAVTVAQGKAIVTSLGGSIYALDKDTGNLDWSTSVNTNLDSPPATVANGTVYAGNDNNGGHLYALDVDTGNKQWSYNVSGGSGVDTAPTIANGMVYFGSSDNNVYAVDADTGTEQWTFATSDWVDAPPTYSNGTVFAGGDGGTLYALDADTGSQQWGTALGGKIDTAPTVGDNGIVYVAAATDRVHAVDVDTGNESWSAPAGNLVGSAGTFVGGGKDKSTGTRSKLHTLGHVGPVGGTPGLSNLSTSSTDSTSTYLTWDVNNVDTTHVEYKTTDNSTWNAYSTLSGSDTSETLTGLLNGEQYDIRVVSGNDSTVQSSSTFTTTLPDDDQPNLTATSAGQITVDRESVTTNNGDVKVQYRENGTSTWTTETVAPYDFTTFDITNLSDGVEYEVRVRTQTDHVTGTWTNPTSTTTIVPTEPISGQVLNQNGEPVSNATVTISGVSYENITLENDSKYESKQEKAQDLLEQARDVKPTSWQPNLQLAGSGGLFSQSDTKYVAVHNRDDWGTRTYSQEADLSNPLLNVPEGEPIILSAWDPSNTGFTQNGVDQQLPGATVDNTDIVIKRIDSSGSVINSRVVSTDRTYSNEVFGVSTYSVDYAQIRLPAGFYRVHPKGSPESQYTIVVGNPDEIANTIRSNLKTEAGELTEQAKEYRNNLDVGKFDEVRVTTDKNGNFNASLPKSVNTVAIQAHKAPAGIQDPKNTTLADIRTYYETTDYNGSVVIPAESKIYDVPNSDADVRVTETTSPNYMNMSRYEDMREAVLSELRNMSYSDLPSFLQQRLNDTNDQEIKELVEETQKLSNQNSELKSKIQDISGQENITVDVNDSSSAELRELLEAQQQAMQELRSDVNAETSTEVNNGTVSSTSVFPMSLDSDDVSVIAHYSNGTSVVVDEKYITVDQQADIPGTESSTTVSVNEFPLSENDPSSVQFAYKVANEESIGKATANAKNPTLDNPPELESVSFSTLRPGPDESVSFDINGEGDTRVQSIVNAEVFGPSGNSINTTTNGNTAQFQTSGSGEYYIQVEFKTASGVNGVFTHRIQASKTDQAMPPGIQTKDTPFGVIAITGDGIESGDITVEDGGRDVTITSRVLKGEDVPSTVHIYTSGMSLSAQNTLTFNMVFDGSGETVDQHVTVLVHTSQINSESAILYRNDQPLPREGSNGNGEVEYTNGGTVISTYTDENGHMKLETNNNPGILESISYQVDQVTSGISLPFTIVTMEFNEVEVIARPAA